MVDFFQWLQDSSLGVWVSTSPSLLAYPTILTLHTVGLAMVVGPNAVLNLRVLGFGRDIPFAALRPIFPAMLVGLLINASTGLALFISEAAEKGTTYTFWIKLSIIAVALVIAVLMKRRIYPTSETVAAAITPGHRVLAVVSCALWVGAIFAGRLMAYLE
jgi:hypothetical protein